MKTTEAKAKSGGAGVPAKRRIPSGPRVTVVIPALNESRTVARVVRFARKNRRVGEVLVIDDGSIDGTDELAEAAGVGERTLLRFEVDETVPTPANLDKILSELARRGIDFTNGTGIGVHLNYEKAAQYARSVAQARNGTDR